MQVKILKTKKDYLLSLERSGEIFPAKPGTEESDKADIVALLIKEYEDKHYFITAPNPLDAIKSRMKQQGLNNKELAEILAFKSRLSYIFKHNRKLNSGMIRT